LVSGRLPEACSYLSGCIEDAAGGSGELLEVIFGDFTAGNLVRVPVYEGGELCGVADSRMDSYIALIEKTNTIEYAGYVSSLSGSGFTVVSERIVNSNIFTILKSADTVVTVTYISGASSVRIAAEPLSRTSIPALEPENYQSVTTPQLTQLGGNDAFLLRLADGSFIIIDGGIGSNSEVLMNQLKSQNTLPGKPVIAAWLLSHAHNDHVDCFIEFSNKYADKIELHNLIINNPGYIILSASKEDNGTCPDAMLKRIKSIEALIEKYDGANITIAHAGQQFFFADTVIDMLYTQEDHYPAAMTVTNSSTLVFSLTLAGQKIMFLNDAYTDTMRTLYNMYGETLKSDIVQVAHHGYNGGLASTYQKIGARVAIWTNGYDTVLSGRLFTTKDNSYVAASVSENLMPADSGEIMTLPLPYKVGSAPTFVRTL
jgi:beta-lactamase superfamily II metal-dependent hydrolase